MDTAAARARGRVTLAHYEADQIIATARAQSEAILTEARELAEALLASARAQAGAPFPVDDDLRYSARLIGLPMIEAGRTPGDVARELERQLGVNGLADLVAYVYGASEA